MATEAPCRKSSKGIVLNPSSSSSSCFITNLPNPIVMEILCSLPLKTLATCKSVCKSWLHLIRDPHFSQLHQARAPTELCFQTCLEPDTRKLYMGNFNLLNNFDPFDVKFDTLFELPKFSVSPLFYKHDRKESLYFANSCNGLLCYSGEYKSTRQAVVWNPCTSEFVTFPGPKINKDFPSCRGYGLGFSTKTNKFKILRFRGRKVKGSSAEEVVAEIYTIEKQYPWKIVGQVPFGFPSFPHVVSYGTFLQGTLHWALAGNSPSDICILTFNFEDDQFGRIQLPPNFAKPLQNRRLSSCREILGVLRGCLLITEFTSVGASIWLMKEYGVEASWTKLFCFGATLMERYCVRDSVRKHFRDVVPYGRFLPISYMDNGEILMACTHSIYTTVLFYNPVLKSVRVTGFGHGTLKVIPYRPSFVLLKDSMLGPPVHEFKQRSADTKQGGMYKTLSWTPVKESHGMMFGWN